MSAAVTIRAEALPGDEGFLLELFDSARRPQLSLLGWPEGEVDALLRMQFEAQSCHYRSWYSQATFSVILVNGEAAGRLVVDRAQESLLIVDLAVLPRFQRTGVGGGVVRRLLEEADASARAVRCQVALGNPARSFWDHLGFVPRGINGAHLAMERDARSV